jgi:hypothetical protein
MIIGHSAVYINYVLQSSSAIADCRLPVSSLLLSALPWFVQAMYPVHPFLG